MAIIKCKECGNEISSEARNCPKCGYKIPKSIGCGTAILIIIAIFVALVMISGPDTDYVQSSPESDHSHLQALDHPSPQNKIENPGDQWIYQQSNDQMSKDLVYQAQVFSTNTVNFDFPYSGAQHGSLTLRTHPRHGKDVIFNIARGQILCYSYDKCSVLIRFDDGDPIKYTALSAADNSSETIFIENYNKFAGQMLKAKKVRISVNIYKEGSPVFEFDVSDFDVNKYRPTKIN
ncbi:hypothetical protein SAMN06296273_1185 [Nitrosomonas ureae]|uniref:Zinc-ribbon domain-containing protein n=1 Tax=Nitrosomonas ureae TaxID=44577 RepID=A0A285BWT8_9PROT|nr:zinc ribbon domain-containing protein [Nitrosomonas ureae]SNX59751.1 hypothetical protein SAMN06296273_1185 [Nitrosomonas ureae]